MTYDTSDDVGWITYEEPQGLQLLLNLNLQILSSAHRSPWFPPTRSLVQ